MNINFSLSMNTKALICFIIFVFAICVEATAQDKSINKISIGGKNLCAEILQKEDFNCAPVWTDDRINTQSGRHEIVKEAQMKALNKLGKIGEDSWFNRWCATFLMNEPVQNMQIRIDGNGNKQQRDIKYLTLPETWNADNSQIKFSIKYSDITRKYSSAGASVPKLQRINSIYQRDNRTGNCYCGNDLIEDGRSNARTLGYKYWDWKSNSALAGSFGRPTKLTSIITPESLNIEKESKCKDCFICYREELNITIEIFPELFQRGYFQIPTEFVEMQCTYFDKVSKSNRDTIISEPRYARDPIEAIIYIVLHEIGHIENFLAKESRCGFKYDRELIAQDSSEESAWEFASSIMHYEEDKDAVSVFEHCISDMANKFSNLKEGRLENEDLPSYYSWSTNLPILKIDDLEFTAEILEAKNLSEGIGLIWNWSVYRGEDPIDSEKAKKVVDDIVNALNTNRIPLRFNFESKNRETKISWSYEKGGNTITILYSIGEKGNPKISENKVKNIDLMFLVK